MNARHTVGAVVIGRNEGTRLARCLASVTGEVRATVYVDSGSVDDSVALARAAGVDVVALETDRPFTAARARNAGLEALMESAPDLDYVQFIDGDCELQPSWIPAAMAFLDARPRVAVTCGRRRERFPQSSVYNQVCDAEWDTPIGEARACGGDALVRIAALQGVGGFDPSLIAGEEPELCLRLRRAGWTIWRLPVEMTLHDAAMTRFGQWWQRAVRGGHARAEGMMMHGASNERHGVRGTLRALLWAGVLPLFTLGLIAEFGPAGAWALLAYPAQMLRLALREGARARGAWMRASLLTLIKFPELQGVVGYMLRRLRQRPVNLIEYK